MCWCLVGSLVHIDILHCNSAPIQRPADALAWLPPTPHYECTTFAPITISSPRPNPIPDRGAGVRDGGFQGQVSGELISGHSPPWLACSFSVQATNYQHATERCTLLYAMWMSQLITNYTLSQNVPPSVCYCFDLQQHMLTIWGRNVNDKMTHPTSTTAETRNLHLLLKHCSFARVRVAARFL